MFEVYHAIFAADKLEYACATRAPHGKRFEPRDRTPPAGRAFWPYAESFALAVSSYTVAAQWLDRAAKSQQDLPEKTFKAIGEREPVLQAKRR
jgi:hypothetical protein